MTRGDRLLVGVPGGLLLLVAALALMWRGDYGLTIFLVLPAALGALAAYVVDAKTAWGGIKAGIGANVLGNLVFLGMGVEGLICIAMALPACILMGAVGGYLGYSLRGASRGRTSALLLIPFGTLGWDTTAQPEVFEVRTAVEIAAEPEKIWKHVVPFSELPNPTEWYFRGGVAYPMRARIEGTGKGAVRYCEFSTGPFVEPIETWDEPNLLQFRVTANPPPMHEWSPYHEVLPKHLHGYLVSRKGQFRLTRLPGGRTRLEGTTWYQHGLWPAQYWRLWSDGIIHRIHLRVLSHIRDLSEH